MSFSHASAFEGFLAEDQVGVVTTLRPDGTPHVVPVRFTWDEAEKLVRVLTVAGSRKARNVAAAPGGRAVLCQVSGFQWVTFDGTATVSDDPWRIALAARRYALRYGSPPPSPPDRVVIEIAVDRVRSLNV
ncbi:pyridoxamine 5'-phosphate oxidase family protein [Actinophytocola sp.]|uniref:pyridoxamine 5'-phosphate oxidase family protein n=1 Tax=Actinophytocola sp. TaxID=1872138 RepID=UPI002D7E9C84|nr:TIGR03618 family F420-dependent PPOX class oxidoreductase [Actinophytocola sp.]HET9139217.1 TIGR03618 family F420-dependent PPOX class oxidoreductase [Actinophytocola sp.]